MATTYSSDDDVKHRLGQIADRLPAWVDLDLAREVAHANLRDRLGLLYPSGVPVFAGAGMQAVRWAEASLTAADVLDSVRVNLSTDKVGDAPERLRAYAWGVVEGGVVGYPPGSTTEDDGSGTQVPVSRGPYVSSFTPLSAFPDPYEAARTDSGRFE